MTVFIQRPLIDPLIDRLDQAAYGATDGAAAFAFATRTGIETFFQRSNIRKVADRGRLFLLIGVDAITDLQALLTLEDMLTEFPGLSVKVFYHEQPRSIFHPKISWFYNGTQLTALIGSGNLTPAGLGTTDTAAESPGNWEAYIVQVLEADAATELIKDWDDWLAEPGLGAQLIDLADDRAREKALENAKRYHGKRQGYGAQKHLGKKDANEDTRLDNQGDLSNRAEVLIAEIPKNAPGRWQVNFHKDVFEEFFGYKEGDKTPVFLQHVEDDGSPSQVETRQPILTQSRNYRLELAAGQDISYPEDQNTRPLALYVCLEDRAFRYRLLVPGMPGYEEVRSLLPPGSNPNKMRDRRTDIETVDSAWHSMPEALKPDNDTWPDL